MAFLVCYSLNPPWDHAGAHNKAIYLDQSFYQMIFTRCRSDRSSYVVLREIASLRYKSPEMTLQDERLSLLDSELSTLEASGCKHPQIAQFQQACKRARADGIALTISGDMYPEL